MLDNCLYLLFYKISHILSNKCNIKTALTSKNHFTPAITIYAFFILQFPSLRILGRNCPTVFVFFIHMLSSTPIPVFGSFCYRSLIWNFFSISCLYWDKLIFLNDSNIRLCFSDRLIISFFQSFSHASTIWDIICPICIKK